MNKHLNNWLDKVEGKPPETSNNAIKKERKRQGYDKDYKQEEIARKSEICPACNKEKNKGLIVCWDCFKYRENPLKYSFLPFAKWIKTINQTTNAQ